MSSPKKSFLRDVIGNYMTELGNKDDKVIVVNADLSGTSRNKGFTEAFPNRSFNVGIAEQNMVSFAAGLAHEGFKPYAFSMAPFITMRACEQCRSDVAYATANVKLMGTYSGVSGGISGATHWGIEDCAIMTGMPGIVVLEPCDAIQAKKLMNITSVYKKPMYIRMTCEACCDIYSETDTFEIGKSKIVKDGNDGTILCSGVTVQFALAAAENLKRENIQIRVVDMYSIKPIDQEAILSAIDTKCVLVVQDHNVFGGLGSMVSKYIAESGRGIKFKVLGIDDRFVAMAHAGFLYHKFGYDAEGIYKTMKAMVLSK